MKMKPEKPRDEPLFYIEERSGAAILAGLGPGSILRGRVVRVLPPDKAIVRIRGLNLMAENHSGLKEGDRFRARVKRRGLPLILTPLPEAPPDEISSRLREMGIQSTPLNRSLAQALLANGFSLEREEMEDLLSLWGRVSSLLGEGSIGMRAAILFKRLRTSPSPEMLEALRGEELLIGRKIDEAIRLFPQLSKVLSHLPVSPGDPQFTAKVQGLPQEEDEALREILSPLRRFPAQANPKLRELIEDMGYIRDLQFLSDRSEIMTYRQIPIQEGDGVQTWQLKIEGRGRPIWLRLLGEVGREGRVGLEVRITDQMALLKVWGEEERTGSLLEKRLPELKERVEGLGLKLATPLIWQQRISLSPLFFLCSHWGEAIDVKV